MSALIGVALWALLIWGSRRLARWGRAQGGARTSTVSRNAEPTTGTGPAWEQDVPYALSIDYDSEDDDL